MCKAGIMAPTSSICEARSRNCSESDEDDLSSVVLNQGKSNF